LDRRREKVAIVTGGTANLGLLFAAALASDGADVVLHYNSAGRSDEAKQAAPPTWKSTASRP
jgi:NAD(P)-dependent dehydrogenase (short-subunit alcohol dehydrogenase family)